MLLHTAALRAPCVILSADDTRSFDGFAQRGIAGLVRKSFDILGLDTGAHEGDRAATA